MQLTVHRTRALPHLNYLPTTQRPSDDIRSKAKLDVEPVGQAQESFSKHLIGLVPAGTMISSAGTLAFAVDKANAMPVDQLVQVLQVTPIFKLTTPAAQTLAEQIKAASNSIWGRYVIVGISGGMVTVGVCAWFWPSAVWAWRVVQFIAGALLLVLAVWFLFSHGIVEPAKS